MSSSEDFMWLLLSGDKHTYKPYRRHNMILNVIGMADNSRWVESVTPSHSPMRFINLQDGIEVAVVLGKFHTRDL